MFDGRIETRSCEKIKISCNNKSKGLLPLLLNQQQRKDNNNSVMQLIKDRVCKESIVDVT